MIRRKIIFLFLICFAISLNAQWETTHGPFENPGFARCYFSLGEDTLLAGTTNGVYISTNFGQSWVPLKDGLPEETRVASFAKQGSQLFLSTYYDHEIYKLTGNTWNISSNGINPGTAETAFLASNETHLFAAYNTGIFLSEDYGVTWILVYDALSNSETVNCIAVIDTIVYFGCESGIFASGVFDINWLPKNNGIWGEIKKLFVCGDTIYATRNTYIYPPPTFPCELYRSTDLGDSWESILSDYSFNIKSVTAKDQYIFVGTDNSGLYHSSDYGNNWESSNTIGNYIISVSCFKNLILAGAGPYHYKSRVDSLVWENITSSFEGEFKQFDKLATTNLSLFGCDGFTYGFYRYDSTNNGWNEIYRERVGRIETHNSFIALGSWGYSKLLLSTDDGNSWNSEFDVYYYGPVLLDIYDSTIIIGLWLEYEPYSTWISRNFGNTWSCIDNLGDLYSKHGFINDSIIMISPKQDDVYVSIDDGDNWSIINNGLPDSIYFNGYFSFKGEIYIFSDKGIYYFENNGEEWIPVNENLDSTDIVSCTQNDTSLFVTNGSNIYHSKNPEEGWIPFKQELPQDLSVYSIAIYKDYIYVSHNTNQGILRCYLGDDFSVFEPYLPKYSISVFPNPTDSELNIHISGHYHDAEMEIINMQGILVHTDILNGDSEKINIENFKSGVYLLRIKTNAGCWVKKFIKN